jgi:hypothetical protein
MRSVQRWPLFPYFVGMLLFLASAMGGATGLSGLGIGQQIALWIGASLLSGAVGIMTTPRLAPLTIKKNLQAPVISRENPGTSSSLLSSSACRGLLYLRPRGLLASVEATESAYAYEGSNPSPATQSLSRHSN